MVSVSEADQKVAGSFPGTFALEIFRGIGMELGTNSLLKTTEWVFDWTVADFIKKVNVNRVDKA